MPISKADLLGYLHATGEEPRIDAKGPMLWDGADKSAGLAKDIVALANSRDGGVLVIGKSERDGQFHLDGLTDDQANSFETTRVASWVNSRFNPPINCTCHPLEHDGKRFVVVVVQEFDDIPAICTKPFDPHLKKGALFVRTANSESAPISSVEQLRSLIGMATTKHANQMLGMFQSVLKGHALIEQKPEDEKFKAETEAVISWLKSSIRDGADAGAMTCVIHPVRHEKRWNDVAELKAVIEKSAVNLNREFPRIAPKNYVVEYGISSEWYEDIFCLTWEGLFVAIRLFKENYYEFKSPWIGHAGLPKGKWIEWKMNIGRFVDFFLFASRYVEQFEIGEEFRYEIKAGPLNGRKLVSLEPLAGDDSEPCRATWFKEQSVVSAETFRVSWKEMSAKSAHRFVQYFFGDQIPLKTIEGWVDSITKRM